MKRFLLSTAFFLFGAAVSAMPFLSGKSAVIDGDLSDPVWKSLPWKGDFFELGTGKKAPVQTRFKTFNDGKYIYFAVECDEPAMAKIRKNLYSRDSSLIWMNDSVEVNLVPDSTNVLSGSRQKNMLISGQWKPQFRSAVWITIPSIPTCGVFMWEEPAGLAEKLNFPVRLPCPGKTTSCRSISIR